MTKLLLVDDDRDLVELLSFALGREGYEVLQAYDSPTALRLIEEERPDAAVLDIAVGPWNGLDLLKTIRGRSNIVVIMLTGRADEADKVRGLEYGADDYITKPFTYRELIARLRAQLRGAGRRAPEAATPVASSLRVGPIYLDSAKHVATKRGLPLHLTATEFRLLHYLMANAGTVVKTRTIMKQIWGFDDPSGRDTVRVTMHRLRRKLEDDPTNPQLLQTVPGVGILFAPTPAGV